MNNFTYKHQEKYIHTYLKNLAVILPIDLKVKPILVLLKNMEMSDID